MMGDMHAVTREALGAALMGASLLVLACQENAVTASSAETRNRHAERARMVEQQIVARGIENAAVIAAMRRVPRHLFVSRSEASQAYEDHPLPIGYGQTISQPFIVAFMTEALDLDGSEKVLEIGTGSGYQAAVLGEVAGEVFTIEIVAPLAERARETLAGLGYDNVHVRAGDGYLGWPQEAPFDAVIVTAAPDHVPQPLIDQLAVGGRMIVPVGEDAQNLVLLRRTETGLEQEAVMPVRFVPMTGLVRTAEREPGD